MMTEGSKALLYALDAVSAMGAGDSSGPEMAQSDLDRLADSIAKSQKIRRCGTEDLSEELPENLAENLPENLDDDEDLELV